MWESQRNEIPWEGCTSLPTELEQWNANIAFAQVNLSPLATVEC